MNCLKRHFQQNFFFLQILIIIFKVLGLAPFTFIFPRRSNTDKNHQSTIHTSYSITGSLYNILTSFVSVITVIYVRYTKKQNVLNFKTANIQTLYLILIEIGVHCISTIIVIIFCFKQKILISIVNKIISVDNEIQKHLNQFNQLRDDNYQILVVLIHIIIPFLLNLKALNGDNYTVYVSYHIILGFTIDSLVIQYALFIHFLRKKIHKLNESFLLLANKTDQLTQEFLHSNNSLYNDNIKKFVFIRKTHRSVYEVAWELSDFYSLPILLAILFQCASIILSVYLSILNYKQRIQTPENHGHFWLSIFNICFNLLWILRNIIPIIIVTSYITKTIAEVSIN